MKQKWYISTFVLILVFLGYSRQQEHVPNQEIVMQFVDVEVASDVAENAIASVKKQLQTIGIANIQVRETAAGRLKITYYSDIDVATVKSIFSKQLSLELGYAPVDPIEDGELETFPSNESSIGYNLNVFEIQKSFDAESDFNGYIPEFTPENERLYNLVLDFSINKISAREKSSVEKVAFLIQRKIALSINSSSRIIPEVRAGPASNVNS